MGINFDGLLCPTFLNHIEDQLGSFDPEFTDKAIDLCLPHMPDEFFTAPNYRDLLRDYLVDFFGFDSATDN